MARRSLSFLAATAALSRADVMNSGGVPYGIGNGDGTAAYQADFSGLGEYFEVYGEVKTRYSQVYWTRNPPVELPVDIVQRFKGKVMAVTGYEADQVVRTPDGDKSIPMYHAYNHHYFAWLMGQDGELVRADKPKMVPNPTRWEPRDKAGTSNGGYPTSIVFKENPGGEYRKSYHGYPQGYAQLIHSPKEFVLEPMQIDTHNRAFSPSLYNTSGYEPWFFPKLADRMFNPQSGLNPLIECPCSNRISKTILNQSNIVVDGTCPSTFSTAEECASALAAMIPTIGSVRSVSDPSLPAGCVILPPQTPGQPYSAFFNSAASAKSCGNSQLPEGGLLGQAAALVNLTVSVDLSSGTATITVSGPAANWFGVAFGAEKMADLPYAVVVEGTGDVFERKLADHGPGSVLRPSITVKSSTVIDGTRTVVLTRPTAGLTQDHYSFPTTPGAIKFINALGSAPTLSYHKTKGSSQIVLLPTKSSACLCSADASTYLTYMDSERVAYNTVCEDWPRGDMARQHNPACKMQTYHGGQSCCHHGWFLTDREQESLIPDAVDTYYLKFRFYFQEYTPAGPAPASHQHLSHWVFLIDAQVNDYEEVPCQDGTMCEGSITANLKAKDMGLEDTPATFSGITPLVIAAHCHAPSCIREELYNADTGDLLCRVEARYGKGTGVFDEKDYIALPPCLFGHEPGLRPPVTLRPDTNLRAIKVFNNTFRHLGQMAQWTGLMVYQREARPDPWWQRLWEYLWAPWQPVLDLVV